eukprot:Hpha_TRINITY_DN685_c0_g1::TRINITY_DN685_c0_g1_i1::g.21202::m.21202
MPAEGYFGGVFGRVGEFVRSVADAAAGAEGTAVQRRTSSGRLDSSIVPIDGNMQARLSRGVKYNMKIVIRGARGTGKSALLQRLQGHPYEPVYVKSPQIQAATVRWCSRPSERGGGEGEPVKLEVWDVVDEGFQTPEMERQRKAPKGVPPQVADASNVDVYRGAHGVIFMIDCRKEESLEYVRRELPRVPRDVLVLVCRNFADKVSESVVTPAMVAAMLKERSRATTTFMGEAARGGKVSENYSLAPRQLATSMVNCYGLKQMYHYFNLPFKLLQVQTLEAQLKGLWGDIRRQEGEAAKEDQTYEEYIDWLEGRGKRKERTAPEKQPTEVK